MFLKQMNLNMRHTIDLSKINLDWLITAYNQTSNKENFFNSFFDKLAGTEKLRKQIISGKNTNEIKETWKVGLNQFKKIRKTAPRKHQTETRLS